MLANKHHVHNGTLIYWSPIEHKWVIERGIFLFLEGQNLTCISTRYTN